MRIALIIFCFAQSSWAQVLYNPLDIPLSASGTFGELRTNHFHSGLDLKTDGVEGKKVLAIADGYVSRIYVNPYGFGNAIYLNHYDGTTSVYAHLQRFSSAIKAYVKQEQYKQQKFSVDLNLPPGRIPVEAGELIALSGNSGGSGGPHLHFEMRQSEGQIPLNPMAFGYQVPDTIKPEIQAVRLIEFGPNWEELSIQGINKEGYLGISKPAGIEVMAFDRQNGSANQNGVYAYELWVNRKLQFRMHADAFAFSDSRYLNACINYEHWYRSKKKYLRLYKLPGNFLPMAESFDGNGRIQLQIGQSAEVEVRLMDFAGNTSSYTFKLFGDFVEDTTSSNSQWLSFQHEHKLQIGELRGFLPKGVLYQNAPENISVDSLPKLGWTYQVLEPYIPAHKPFNLSIPLKNIEPKLHSKAVVVWVHPNGKIESEGGRLKENYLEVEVRRFGQFALAVDTIAPSIRALNLKSGSQMGNQQEIRLKGSDNLSGINQFNAFLNGQWALAEFDGKSGTFTVAIDHLPVGQHQFEFELIDARNNKATFSAVFRK